MAFNNVNQFQGFQPSFGQVSPPSFSYPPQGTALQTFQPSPPQPSSSFVWVQGEAGAKAYPVAAGNKVALFDSENPVLYVKSTDLNGRPLEMETYDLVKRESISPVSVESKIDLSNYITRDEIEAIIVESARKEVDRAISEISLKPTPKKKRGDDE